jgi:hypothetical protein
MNNLGMAYGLCVTTESADLSPVPAGPGIGTICGLTAIPGCTFCRPSMMTRSPGFSSWSMTRNSSIYWEATTFRARTSLSRLTVRTDCMPWNFWTALCGMSSALCFSSLL